MGGGGSRWWWPNTSGRNDIICELNMGDGSGFCNFTRMSPSDFEMLNIIGPFVSKKGTDFRKKIPLKQRFLVTLHFLATEDSYQSLAYLFTHKS